MLPSKGRSYIRVVLNVFSDGIAFYSSFFFAFFLRKIIGDLFPNYFPPFDHSISLYLSYIPFIGTYVAILGLLGIPFRKKFFWEDVREYFKAITVYGLIIFAFLSLSRQIYDFSRTVLGLHVFSLFLINPLMRYWTNILFISKFLPTYVCYLGPKENFKSFFYHFLKDKYLGLKLTNIDEAEYIYLSDKLNNYWEMFLNLQKKKRKVYILEEKMDFPPMIYKTHLKIGVNVIAMEYENRLLNDINLAIKRIIDYFISLLLLPLIALIILIIAILIKLDSPGPIFYYHTRVGKNGRKFKCIKFRTMFVDADKKLEEILKKDESKRREWENYGKLTEDPRITRVGKFLRRTSLDELPQIINVLRGEMSLVGPRPITEEELDKYYGKFKEYYISVYPGITGLWQVSGRNKLSYKERVYLDTWYVLNWSIWLDFIILLKTVREVFKPSGI